MLTHLSKQQIEARSNHLLSPDESATVNEHLAGCEACHRRLLSILLSGVRFPMRLDPCQWSGFRQEHLTDDEIEGYVEGKLDDYELRRAMLHKAVCPECKH